MIRGFKYGLGYAQVDFSNETLVLLPFYLVFFVGTGLGDAHKGTFKDTHTH